MSEDQTDSPAAGEPSGQPPSIVCNAQYLKDLSFENPQAPRSLVGQAEEPKVEVGIDVNAQPVSEGVYEVVLHLRAEARRSGEVMFMAEVSYAGLFTLTGIPEESRGPALLIECPRLIFPFARAILASATRDGGFPPLMIQPVDFAGIYRRSLAERGEGVAGTA